MSGWDTYAARIQVSGETRRAEHKRREFHQLNNRLRSSLSYHNVIMDGGDREVSIINSDNLDEKYIYSMPGETIDCGAMVEWMDNWWIVSEVDANNEIYTRAKMLQCNYLLKWIEITDDKTPKIIEQWCYIEDGTKLERTLLCA